MGRIFPRIEENGSLPGEILLSVKSLVRGEEMARVTGLEPATSGVTGRHSNRLSYTRILESYRMAKHPSRAA